MALELARTLGETVAGALFTCSWIIHLFAYLLIQQAARERLPVFGINQGPALLFHLSELQGRQTPESLSPCPGGIPGGNQRDAFLALRGGDLKGASEQLCVDPWTTPAVHPTVSREGPCTPTFPLGGCHWRMLSLGLADHTGCDGQAFPGWRWHLKVLTGWSVSSGASTTTLGVGGSFKTEGTYVHLLLIHVATRQKPTQYCKAIILQLKRNFKKEPSMRCLDQNHSRERRCRECFGA